ncbi:MAG: Maf-like protein [Prevotellaceae bacterium]|jgi:septum formation protein|nr:Maf-like protein [Prevotellaceae bacterium]
MLENYRILLGSQSPRRQELLKGLDIPFEVVTAEVEECYPDSLKGADIPLFLAKQKADALRLNMERNTLLITADTIVWLDGKVYGKPADMDEAREMLHQLSGKTHKVITGVVVTTADRQESFSASTLVTFTELSDNEIDCYLKRYHPADKAGSYGVQEWIGYIGVERIEGSYYNVMGLPVQRLYQLLKTFG